MRVQVGDISLFVRRSGAGQPLLMLHGFPETGACWDKVAPAFAQEFEVIVPDLRGYGASDAPESENGVLYTKRNMAADMVALMAELGHERFMVLGHDRGARVSYRLALDHPDRVTRLGIIEVVPTGDMWASFNADLALGAFHWTFLAEPAPFPEQMILANPDQFLDHLMRQWSGTGDLSPFASDAYAAYRAQMRDPARVHAMCEDYRAGARLDRAYDEADKAEGRRIQCPLHFVYSDNGFPAKAGGPATLWRGWADKVTTAEIPDCGHFIQEEQPDALIAAYLPFFKG